MRWLWNNTSDSSNKPVQVLSRPSSWNISSFAQILLGFPYGHQQEHIEGRSKNVPTVNQRLVCLMEVLGSEFRA